jgi:hypothetical protein
VDFSGFAAIVLAMFILCGCSGGSGKPGVGGVKDHIQSGMDENALQCIRIASVDKVNGIDGERNGTKTYELDCKVTLECEKSCIVGGDLNNLKAYPDPVIDGSTVSYGFAWNYGAGHTIVPATGWDRFPRDYYKQGESWTQDFNVTYLMTDNGWMPQW